MMDPLTVANETMRGIWLLTSVPTRGATNANTKEPANKAADNGWNFHASLIICSTKTTGCSGSGCHNDHKNAVAAIASIPIDHLSRFAIASASTPAKSAKALARSGCNATIRAKATTVLFAALAKAKQLQAEKANRHAI